MKPYKSNREKDISQVASQKRAIDLILSDYHTCLSLIENLMNASVEERRVSRLENNKLRKEALAILHQIQIQSLKEWRAAKESKPEKSDELLLKLLLLVNALAGGLKGTG